MSQALAVPARHNPLAVEHLERLRYRFAQGTWDDHLEQLARLGYRGAIVGRHGCGKTTLLTELATHMPQRGTQVLAQRAARDGGTSRAELAAWVEQLVPGQVLLLDSAEQLRRIDWGWLVRTTATRQLGLVVTVHRRCRLPTWIRCRSAPELLVQLLRDLGFEPTRHVRVFERATVWLARHRGNVREVLRSLYDEIATGAVA